jgi:plastocyanin
MTTRRTRLTHALAAAAVGLGLAGPAWAGGTIAGKVVFEGTPPPPKAIQFGAEKQCALAHQHGAPTVEDIVVNDNGTLKWVLVRLTEVAGEFPVPTEPVVIDQQGCVFLPHVSLARVGQPVEFRNSDPVLHNVRGASKQKQGFNVAQPVQGSKTTRIFKNPEIGMLLRCDVHFWMASYLHVLPHPFAAVTQAEGTFTISDVPAGTYTLEAWHEKLGTQTQQVTVEDGGSSEVVFTYAAP